MSTLVTKGEELRVEGIMPKIAVIDTGAPLTPELLLPLHKCWLQGVGSTKGHTMCLISMNLFC